MARKFSTLAHTVDRLNITVRFEAEQLNEQGLVLDDSFGLEFHEYFHGLEIAKDSTLEQTAQTVYDHFTDKLNSDPANVYANLIGDEYPRVRVIFVDVQGDYTATVGD